MVLLCQSQSCGYRLHLQCTSAPCLLFIMLHVLMVLHATTDGKQQLQTPVHASGEPRLHAPVEQ